MPPSTDTSKKDGKQRTNKVEIRLEADYRVGIGKELELQSYTICLYAAWLARAVVRHSGMNTNTSRLTGHSSQNALTSRPNDCTVGTPRYCKTGGSNI